MKRALIGIALASGLAVVLGACSDHDRHGDEGGGASTMMDPSSAYSSCDTCTPVVGCGWCFSTGGELGCASGPESCGATGDTWDWDPTGCTLAARPIVGDAGGDQ